MELGHYYLLKRKPNLMERLYEVIIPLSLGGFPLDLLPVAVEEAGTLEVKSHPQTHLGPEDPLPRLPPLMTCLAKTALSQKHPSQGGGGGRLEAFCITSDVHRWELRRQISRTRSVKGRRRRSLSWASASAEEATPDGH